MEIHIDWEWLKTQKLFLATPMYGGQCYGTYMRSVSEVVTIFSQQQIPLQLYSLFNESLITRARAYACDEFLRTDATHLLFLDADVGFQAQDVICMMALMKDGNDYDIMGAPYPKKCISFEKLKVAVDKGFCDKDPRVMENFVGDFVFNPLPGTTSFSVLEPAEMLEIGTGFMMIKRKVLEDYRDSYPEYQFLPDHIRTEHFDGSRPVTMFFQAEIDRPFLEKPFRAALEKIAEGDTEYNFKAKEIAREALAAADQEMKRHSKRYLSEDYLFCQKARKIGKHVWLCPWMQTTHSGTFIFGGSVAAMGALGVSATADPELLGKGRGNLPTASGVAPLNVKAKKPRQKRRQTA